MTETSEEITINGTKYKEEDFNQEQKYFLNQIRSCRVKITELNFEVDKMKVAEQGFSNAFKNSMQNEENSKEISDDS